MEVATPNELHRDPSALRGSKIRIEEAPEWTTRRKVKNLPRIDGYPVTLLLLDRQIAPELMSRYTRFVRRLETPQAVQECGRVEFNFDPATQSVVIHAISIFRDGELTNYADLDQIEVIQPERDLHKGIYDGNITALTLLKDLRTGDIIDIESSIISDNTIFTDHYWFLENFQHTLPISRQYFSLLSQDHPKFQIEAASSIGECTEEPTTWGIRKTWQQEQPKALILPNLLPIGFNPFDLISFTTFKSWGEVAKAVADLWQRTETPGDDLLAELAKLQQKDYQNDEEQIEALVSFVRDSIRYQGVEIGKLGLVPENLNTIWERRFGDCKEKTSLLCWLLRECGFQATPALVSTSLQGRIKDHLPAPIFDHVLVHIRHNEQDFWVDPTVISQRGTLKTWNSLVFEQALIISPDTTGFLEIAPAPARQNFTSVAEVYKFQGENATIDITHEFHGTEADGIRATIDSNGRSEIQKSFTEFVKSTRPEAELKTDLDIKDDPEANHITVKAEFDAPKMLRKNPETGSYFCDFVPYSLTPNISLIDQSNRTFPLALHHPTEIYHSLQIHHPSARGAILPKVIINNEFLDFEAGTKDEKTTPTVYYRYKTKTSEIPAKELHRYRLNIEQIGSVIPLIFETGDLHLKKGIPINTNRSVADDQRNPTGLPRRRKSSRQHHHHQERQEGSSFPIWPIFVVFFIIIKIIAVVLRSAAP